MVRCKNNENCICYDINGVEIEEGMILVSPWGSRKNVIGCVVQAKSGRHFIACMGAIPEDIEIKPIEESENYEVSYEYGMGGFYKNRKNNVALSRVLEAL